MIKRIFKYFVLGESLKEIVMNRILDKMSKKNKLSQRESSFFNLYNETQKKSSHITDKKIFVVDTDKDYMYLSKNVVVVKIKELISLKKKVICDLHDRDGRIGLYILEVLDDHQEETSTILMRGDEKHELHDKFLYNLIYNISKDEYSLQEQDEYFEKIEAKNGEN